MKLPPDPPLDGTLAWWDQKSRRHIDNNAGAFSRATLRAYGLACAIAMREECAKANDDYVNTTGRGLSGAAIRGIEVER